jgi:hypothetical protein
LRLEHGNSALKRVFKTLIEKGEDKKGKFYKVYYQEEN